MLDQIKIASPCTADWEQMQGTEQVRFCAECKKNVYNLSALSRRDAEALIKQTNGNLCARLYRRADGTVLTEDCPVGLSIKITRVRRKIGWAVASALSLSSAFAQDDAMLSGSIRNADKSPAANVTVLIKGEQTKIETTTDEHGAFKVSVAPGAYTISSAGLNAQVEATAGAAIEVVIAPMKVFEVMGGPSFIRKPWWKRII
jgi:hypothetical protein